MRAYGSYAKFARVFVESIPLCHSPQMPSPR